MTDALIVSAARTPVGKAPNGSLRSTRPDELAAVVMREVLNRAPGVDAAEIEDVILGCAMPEAEQGLNVARIASLRAGLPVEASAVTVNRFCASGLQAIAFAADRIKGGSANAIIAGGTESMSLVPMGGNKVAPNPALVDHYPDVYLTTGLVAENHARDHGISREEQDAFALRSHQRALAALDSGSIQRRNHRHRRVRGRRRPAARHFARRALEAPTRVSCQGHRDRRQFVADERRRGRRARHVRSICARADIDAARPLRGVRNRRSAHRNASAPDRFPQSGRS